ncbi:MAG: AAA family ATPase, partial [Chloroflexi bacterium]|nr:AAA family ATPase [Chloroflexota bacterium]
MLQELTIRNFAILERLHVQWAPGLNVITGETGAGKSILVDAVGALLGDRLGPEAVRSGADRAIIEGIFVVEGEVPPSLRSLMEDYGLELEDGGLIVSREIAGSGGRGS